MDWLLPVKQVFSLFLPALNEVPILRGALGFVTVFFIPGFAWTLVFFKKLHPLERVVLSIGLSIAIVPISVIALNVILNMRITGLNSVLTIGLLTAVPVSIYLFRRRARKNVE